MIVDEVIYVSEGAAGQTADWIRLKMQLLHNGVLVQSETFEGESNTMNRRAWMLEPHEADTLVVEAHDVEIDSQYLQVGPHKFGIPVTGPLQTRTYRFSL